MNKDNHVIVTLLVITFLTQVIFMRHVIDEMNKIEHIAKICVTTGD